LRRYTKGTPGLANILLRHTSAGPFNRPILVYRLGEMPIQICGQSVSAPRGKAGARLNAHTELRTKRQRCAREAIYGNRPIVPYLAQLKLFCP
jgi:hypothetical protein